MIERYQQFYQAPSRLLVCYGGPEKFFDQINHSDKIFLDDPRLRTVHHQRDKQSYTQIFQKVSMWLKDKPELAYIYLTEYDQWPLIPDIHTRLIERLLRERADVLGHQLARRDQTSCVHYLTQMSDPRFLPWLNEISRRADRGAVFNMFGSGSFWTREAFLAIGQREEPFPMYLELYLPTLAHHLGFRVRDFQDQNRFISALGDRMAELDAARDSGAWTIHPIKKWPSNSDV